MELRGLDYTGRNVGRDLHVQFKKMVDSLSDDSFIRQRTWGTDIQEDLANRIGADSSGAIRTIKTMLVMLGFIKKDSLSRGVKICRTTMLTKRGEALYGVICLEDQILADSSIDDAKRKAAEIEIKKLYEEIYCEAMMHYYYTNRDGSHFCPLRATLQALDKYERLDKWEWYLLNTFVRHDDSNEEFALFEKVLTEYRNGLHTLSISNVVEKPKGHQYIPQYFEYAGLVTVIQRPEWSMSHSQRHDEIKKKVLSPTFLTELYGGK